MEVRIVVDSVEGNELNSCKTATAARIALASFLLRCLRSFKAVSASRLQRPHQDYTLKPERAFRRFALAGF